MDFDAACRVFLADVLLLEPGERLLLYAEEGESSSAAAHLQLSAKAQGVPTDLLLLPGSEDLPHWIKLLDDAIAQGSYRAVCEMSRHYFYPTPVWGRAIRAGARVYGLGPMDEAAFIRCVGEVDHQGLHQFGLALQRIMHAARMVRIQSPAGTDLVVKMNGKGLWPRLLTRFGRREASKVWPPSGLLSNTPSATFVGGQLAFLGRPATISGTAVIDGYLSPPFEIGRLENPVIMTIEAGRVSGITGCPTAVPLLEDWLRDDEKQVMHFCIGFNPGAGLTGALMEAERAYGHITIGIGQYPQHTDGVIEGARLVVNGQTVMEHNYFPHPDLLAPARALRR